MTDKPKGPFTKRVKKLKPVPPPVREIKDSPGTTGVMLVIVAAMVLFLLGNCACMLFDYFGDGACAALFTVQDSQ